jgi:hypothetical protein
MIRDVDHLTTHIGETLKTQPTCRVFCHVLQVCWNVPEKQQAAEIAAFAARHGWKVEVHEPAAYGIVADFSRNGA